MTYLTVLYKASIFGNCFLASSNEGIFLRCLVTLDLVLVKGRRSLLLWISEYELYTYVITNIFKGSCGPKIIIEVQKFWNFENDFFAYIFENSPEVRGIKLLYINDPATILTIMPTIASTIIYTHKNMIKYLQPYIKWHHIVLIVQHPLVIFSV